MPYHTPNNSNPVTRGEQGFGSTDDQVVCFNQQILSDQPTCKIKIQGKTSVLLDTVTDVFIIAFHEWPTDRPLTEPQGKISGLEEPQQFARSAAVLPCLGPDKQLTHFQPFYWRHSLQFMGQRSACPMAPSSHQQGKDKSYDGKNGVPTRKRARKKFTGRYFSFTYSAQIE